MADNIFTRTEMLIGKQDLEKLKKSKVIVFGVGGVGGYTVEALVRSNIGEITIVDYDTIDITNINRQIIALHSTVGKYKVDAFRERIHDINPDCKVNVYKEKLTVDNIDYFNLKGYDYIIDAIDNISSKIALAKYAYENNLSIISSMGMGAKLDPTRIKVSDVHKTSVCPLARVMRRELRKRNVKKLKCVWSDEDSKGLHIENDTIGKRTPSSISFVPSAAGLIIGGEVIKDLIS